MTAGTDLTVTLLFVSMTLGHLVGARTGDSCRSHDDCPQIPNGQCVRSGLSGVCGCIRGYVQNATVEYVKDECFVPLTPPTKLLGQPCSWGDALCPATQHFECGSRDHCPCTDGTEYSSSASKKCGLPSGVDCPYNGGPHRDNASSSDSGGPDRDMVGHGPQLCASGSCVTNVTSVAELIGKCACASIYGFERAWPPEPEEGCVINLQHLACVTS